MSEIHLPPEFIDTRPRCIFHRWTIAARGRTIWGASRTFYMHVGGHGDPDKMAAAIHAALSSASKTSFEPPATTAAATQPIDLDTAKIDQAMGAQGTANGGVYQFGIPRREPARDSGMQVSPRSAAPTPSTSNRPAAARPRSRAISW